jgi:hypothetical protein
LLNVFGAVQVTSAFAPHVHLQAVCVDILNQSWQWKRKVFVTHPLCPVSGTGCTT